MASMADACKGILDLPTEVILQIFGLLSPQDLCRIQRTSSAARTLAQDKGIWQDLVQDAVPGLKITSTGPLESFQALYASQYPNWFLLKNRVWISDRGWVGKIVLNFFDPRRGCIEGLVLLCGTQPIKHVRWKPGRPIWVTLFEPEVKLYMDSPELRLKPKPMVEERDLLAYAPGFYSSIRMDPLSHRDSPHSSFILAKSIPETAQYAESSLWPVNLIPSKSRVRILPDNEFDDPPRKISEINQNAFRIVKRTAVESFNVPLMTRVLDTYSGLNPDLYRPTSERPYQGIWVGDYSSHGAEFLLVRQILPEDENSDSGPVLPDVQSSSETIETSEDLPKGDRGRLEAIKLTGDPNIPQGHYTWVADVGLSGLIRLNSDDFFGRCRVVRACGQVADHGFRNGESLVLICLNFG
ncbi:MAG: hypothetical protein M1814_005601 [Vezdaea aestivalis]|nr:MAG: hypothetical protein M1814_005601 [Vezdaea aestivalis]